MGATSRLVFDPTDANSIAASSSIGAYLRGGNGTVIDSQTVNSEEWMNTATILYDDAGAPINAGNPLEVNLAGVVDLDIRDLTHVSDSIRLGDGTAFFTSTTVSGDIGLDVNLINASIEVTATQLDIDDLNATDDAVQAWCFDGTGNAIGSTTGSLDVNVTNAIDVDDGIADTAIANVATAVSTSAVNCVATALANRKYIAYANEGNKTIYFGKTGLTAANGFPCHPGQQHDWRVGPSVTPQFFGGNGASAEDIRVMELS